MTKVITYGTYDMLHYGHIRLLERAKELGDYLIVGITSDSFDRLRGKINIKQSLEERIEAIRDTGIADEILIEEYEGQKIDDIKRLDVDIFTVGSDWKGHFDYLNEYCKVVYLDRTAGISSTELRAVERKLRVGLVGNSSIELEKFAKESKYVNGVEVTALNSKCKSVLSTQLTDAISYIDDYNNFLDAVDAVYLVSNPQKHFNQIKTALEKGKHVLCESPVCIGSDKVKALMKIADDNGCILMESLKTAYSLAFSRLKLIVKSGYIGKVVSVDSTCTSLINNENNDRGSLYSWGPFGLLPVFSILGTDFVSKSIQAINNENNNDDFVRISFIYDKAVATVKVANGAKSEGELIITGTKGYVFVPAPWWKTDYFEIRYENMSDNKRYFYQLEGEGIRNTIVSFIKAVQSGNASSCITENETLAIADIMKDFENGTDTLIL